jgi:hypothetical protein
MADTVPVAVIVPVYNRRIKLIRTLESVVTQSKLPALLALSMTVQPTEREN